MRSLFEKNFSLVFVLRFHPTRRSFRYDLIFIWKLFEWIRDRFERTIGGLTLWMKLSNKTVTFINRRGRFFHYEP